MSGLFTSCQTCSRDVVALIAAGTSASTWIRSVTGSAAERAQVLQSRLVSTADAFKDLYDLKGSQLVSMSLGSDIRQNFPLNPVTT